METSPLRCWMKHLIDHVVHVVVITLGNYTKLKHEHEEKANTDR
ncbi:hypothetical protein VCR15J2_460071 [Vibrio coralliirubri]|nr:hypothetical protein VCR15J2_460071 [Vibrio coralliirubri]